MINQAYRFELRPRPSQVRKLNAHCAFDRLAHNWYLIKHRDWWETNKDKDKDKRADRPTATAASREWTQLAPHEFPWTKKCARSVTSYAFKAVDAAYRNYFRRLKEGYKAHEAGEPKTVPRHAGTSFTVQPASGEATLKWAARCIRPWSIRLPNIGWVRTKERTDKFKGRILRIAVSERAGHWYASLMVERPEKSKVVASGVAGVDLGINMLATIWVVDTKPLSEQDRQDLRKMLRTKIEISEYDTSKAGQYAYSIHVDSPRALAKSLRKLRGMSHRLTRRTSVPYKRMLRVMADQPNGLTPKSLMGKARIPWKSGASEDMLRRGLRNGHLTQIGTYVLLTPRGLSRAAGPPGQSYRLSRTGRYVAVPSKRWLRAKDALARLHKRIADQRLDYLHKVTTWLSTRYQTIVVEGFRVQKLITKERRQVKKRSRRREISDQGWGMSRVMLTYKCGWYGTTLIELPKDEPTDRTCHACGTLNEKLSEYATTFTCEACEVQLPRQLNTAKYAASFGGPPSESPRGHSGSDGRGESPSPKGSPGGTPTRRSGNNAHGAVSGGPNLGATG
jgi:IS605 OrfB family transposase